MSKTITVPDIGMYPIEITLNNKKYTLHPGTEATVPDGVAKILDQIVASKPKPAVDGWKNAWATIKDAEQYSGDDEGDEPEVVLEIEVGDLTAAGDVFVWQDTETSEEPEIKEGEVYYLNNMETPSTVVEIREDGPSIGWNTADIDAPEPVEPGQPMTLVGWDDGVLGVMTTDSGIAHTTIRILKKAATPSGLPAVTSADNGKVLTVVYGAWAKASLPENLKPTYEFGFTVTPGSEQGTFVATPDSGVTYAAIAAALAVTPNVYAVLDLSFQDQVIRALFSVDSTATGAESTSAIGMFWGGTKWMGARLMVSAIGADLILRET